MEVATRSAGLKVLALCTALGLGGGYVWQRQKAAAAAAEKSEQEEHELQRTVLPGSKSAWGFSPGSRGVSNKGQEPEPVLPPVVEEEKKVEERTVLPGSKSYRIVPPQQTQEKP
jgi:hypothetical protein